MVNGYSLLNRIPQSRHYRLCLYCTHQSIYTELSTINDNDISAHHLPFLKTSKGFPSCISKARSRCQGAQLCGCTDSRPPWTAGSRNSWMAIAPPHAPGREPPSPPPRPWGTWERAPGSHGVGERGARTSCPGRGADIHLENPGRDSDDQGHLMLRTLGILATLRPICRSGTLPAPRWLAPFSGAWAPGGSGPHRERAGKAGVTHPGGSPPPLPVPTPGPAPRSHRAC